MVAFSLAFSPFRKFRRRMMEERQNQIWWARLAAPKEWSKPRTRSDKIMILVIGHPWGNRSQAPWLELRSNNSLLPLKKTFPRSIPGTWQVILIILTANHKAITTTAVAELVLAEWCPTSLTQLLRNSNSQSRLAEHLVVEVVPLAASLNRLLMSKTKIRGDSD